MAGQAVTAKREDIRLGYIGLGDIGSGMATNLAKAGYAIKVHDLRAEALTGAVEKGAVAAENLAEIVEFADVIHICLVYDDQVENMITGEAGILALGRRGQIVIVHSSIFPETVRRCAAATEAYGIQVIDAPVSGAGHLAAAAGNLTIMVGGPVETVEYCRPILEVMGKVRRVGEVGAGEAMKLTNNAMAHTNRLVYLEALHIAEAYGIDEETVNRVVTKSTGMSYSQINHARPDSHILRHTMAGSAELPYRFSKDLRYATSIGLQKLLPLPMIAMASQLAPDAYTRRWKRVAEAHAASRNQEQDKG